jgi:protein TonB
MKAQRGGGIVAVKGFIETRTSEEAMLAVLLESRAARQTHLRGTLLSTFVHGTVIAAAVALSMSGRGRHGPAPQVHPVSVTYVQPIRPETPTQSRTSASVSSVPAGPRLPVIEVPVITPVGIPPVDLTMPATSAGEFRIGARPDPGAVAGPALPLGGNDVNESSAVDRAPHIMGRATAPLYPPALRAAGVEGRVLAEFVVDTVGRAELATLRFPELPDPRFADAVRDAISRTRFSPGEVAGRPVRTRVVLPFDFRLLRR